MLRHCARLIKQMKTREQVTKPAGNAIDGLLATARPFLAEELLISLGYTWDADSKWVAPGKPNCEAKAGDEERDALAADNKALRDANAKLTSPPVDPRRAPVQRYHGKTVPWEVHGLAWEGYCRDYGSGCQSAERIAERGGFGVGEMDKYLPDWRERSAAIDARASAATGGGNV